MKISEAQHVHFIGIGGIGMSALSRMLVHRGMQVSGSDKAQSALTRALESEGIDIKYEQVPENIDNNIDLVIYTDAVAKDNSELLTARKMGITSLSYFEALGEIAKEYKVIAIAGTHGKTTTTAMVAQALIATGIDPTVIVGSLTDFGDGKQTNFRASTSTSLSATTSNKLLVVEACEYKRHFLNFNPYILAVTNIEFDHPDYYKDLRDTEDAFAELASQSEVVLAQDSIERYMLSVPGLKVPGEYNRRNAALALAICDELGVDIQEAKGALEDFNGTWRRFEYKGKTKSGAMVYDDYAHHPTAIREMLRGAREQIPSLSSGQVPKIIAVFEPHTYTRTAELMDDFASSFTNADEVIIAPIYSAREDPIVGITAESLAQNISKYNTNVQSVDSLETAVSKAEELANKGDMIIFMGAGDLYIHVKSVVLTDV